MCGFVPHTGLQAASVAPLQLGTATGAVPALHQNTPSNRSLTCTGVSSRVSSNNCTAAVQRPPTEAYMQAANQQQAAKGPIKTALRAPSCMIQALQDTNQQNSMPHHIQAWRCKPTDRTAPSLDASPCCSRRGLAAVKVTQETHWVSCNPRSTMTSSTLGQTPQGRNCTAVQLHPAAAPFAWSDTLQIM